MFNEERRPDRVWTEQDEINQTSCNLLNNIIPFDPNRPYSMHLVIESVLDRNKFFEIMRLVMSKRVLGLEHYLYLLKLRD